MINEPRLLLVDENVNVPASISKLRNYAKTALEYGMPISKDELGRSYVPNGMGGSDGISSGTGVNVLVLYSESTYMKIHTHPSGTLASPSPRDLINMYGTIKYQIDDYQIINMESSIVFAANGTEYASVVNNITDIQNILIKFMDSKYSDFKTFFHFTDSTDNEFIPRSVWQNLYKDIYTRMKTNVYPDEDANVYALTYIIDQKNMGLKIMKRSSAAGEFRELKTEYDGNKYIPKICTER